MIVLAQDMSAGLATNASVYPAPADPRSHTEAYTTACAAAVPTQDAADRATAAKTDALQALCDDYDDQLKLIGWGRRESKTSLDAPGHTSSLEAPRECEGRVFFDWKVPVDGGAVAACKIQSSLRPDGLWTDAGVAMESEITLTDQARGKEWEYRVIAVNKAGESESRNTVMVVR